MQPPCGRPLTYWEMQWASSIATSLIGAPPPARAACSFRRRAENPSVASSSGVTYSRDRRLGCRGPGCCTAAAAAAAAADRGGVPFRGCASASSCRRTSRRSGSLRVEARYSALSPLARKPATWSCSSAVGGVGGVGGLVGSGAGGWERAASWDLSAGGTWVCCRASVIAAASNQLVEPTSLPVSMFWHRHTNQRGHDDHQALRRHGCGDRVTQGLATSCRHQHEAVAARQRAADRSLLHTTELIVPEYVLEGGDQVGFRSGRHLCRGSKAA